jgi:hypothetical protein
MLAPTRDLVADLNHRARAHRLRHAHPGREVHLADGNRASVGDVIITRTNADSASPPPTGSRTATAGPSPRSTHDDITVRHQRSQLIGLLPTKYVQTSTGLGYATTTTAPKASPPTPCTDFSPARNTAETGDHPLHHLQKAAGGRDLTPAGDMAAVLHWRLPTTANASDGPLPWLRQIPTQLQTDPTWGTYLAQRAQLVTEPADSVRADAAQTGIMPTWADPRSNINPKLLGDITVWRAANGIDTQDSRPTGQPRLDTARLLPQQHLDAAIAETRPPSHTHWITTRNWRPDRSVAVTTTCSRGDPHLNRPHPNARAGGFPGSQPASVNSRSGPFLPCRGRCLVTVDALQFCAS